PRSAALARSAWASASARSSPARRRISPRSRCAPRSSRPATTSHRISPMPPDASTSRTSGSRAGSRCARANCRVPRSRAWSRVCTCGRMRSADWQGIETNQFSRGGAVTRTSAWALAAAIALAAGCATQEAPKPAPAPEPKPAPAPAPAPAPTPPPPAPKPKPVAEKVTFATDVLFDFDKSVVKPEGKAKLDDLAAKIRGVNLEVVIAIGHTDSIGSDAYNQQLSVRRAESVKAYLVSKGIEANRVYTEGKGEKQPV